MSRTIFIAVSGVTDRTFRTYDKACAWLDEISPATATRGFECEHGGESDGVETIFVRHAEIPAE
jgi:hypothetical protein